MKLAILLLLLLAVPARGGTFTTQFAPFPGSPPHTITKSGITMTIGDGWIIAADNDMPNPPPPNLAITSGTFGNFANEGPLNTVLYHSPCPPEGCVAPFLYDNFVWRFSMPIHQISFEYTGSKYQSWHENGNQYISPGTLPLRVWLLNYANYEVVADVLGDTGFSGHAYIDYGYGYSEGTPCSGDPTGDFCNWGTFSYVSAAPFQDVWVSGYGFFGAGPEGPHTGLWIKSLTVSTDMPCPQPPCGFERTDAPRGETITPAQRTSWGRVKAIYR